MPIRSRVFKRYVLSYLSVVLAVCMALGLALVRVASGQLRQAETEGLTIAEALRYESGLRFLEDEIQREAKRLREYEAAAEEKRRQVVAARQDTASLEKLKDKKWEDYQKQVQKGEELLIEELVTAARARTAV